MDNAPQIKITGEVQTSSALLKNVRDEVQSVYDLAKLLADKHDANATELILFMLISALTLEASDVHIEAEEQQARIRLRIDGILQDVSSLPLPIYETLLSRIKLLSQIKLNIAERPQDGRFSFDLEGEGTVEVRTSTLPSEHGESVVLRLLNPKSLIGLKDLGLREDLLSLFMKEIQRPNGMILVTGPTGSGKTTTLYAFVKEVQKPQIKIITIEDPIEYHIEGISQTQVRPEQGYDFASGLRAIVRQDPDVILVGEVRDKETAEIALQASLTGHLVFSTLHTNDAAGSVSRLTSLGVKPVGTIASAVTLLVAQRLVRKLCLACKTTRALSAEEAKKIQEALHDLPKTMVKKPSERVASASKEGCPKCNLTGYRGRIGIFEAIAIDDAMESFLLAGPSIPDIKNFSKKQGMIPMYQDGVLKVLEGITTLEEVERVSRE